MVHRVNSYYFTKKNTQVTWIREVVYLAFTFTIIVQLPRISELTITVTVRVYYTQSLKQWVYWTHTFIQ